MKKYLLSAAAFAALMTCACSVEPVDIQPEEEEITVLSAGFAGAEDGTRTVRQEDGKVFWSAKESISVIRGSSRKKFVSTNTEPVARTTFTGSMPLRTGPYWAVYPYSKDNEINSGLFVTTLPDKQEAVAGSFADNLFISAAYVDEEESSLTFHHQCGGVKFSVTQPGVKRVTLIPADEDVYPAGLVGLYASKPGETPYIAAYGYPQYMSSRVELSAPDGETLEVGAAYHFVILPVELTGGFSLLFEKEDGASCIRTIEKDVTIRPAHFATLMEADKGLTYGHYMDYSPKAIELDGLGGLFTLHVEGNMEYHVDAYSDWFREVPTTGDARFGRDLVFVADRNDGAERQGMLAVCYDNNCYPVMVTQKGLDGLKVYPHRTLGMRFTSTGCGYCPMMDEAFRKAKSSLGDTFEYVCYYTTYNSGKYSFEGSLALNDYYRISSYPSGIIDGRYELGNYNSTSTTASVLASEAATTVAYYPTATAIGLKSALSGSNLSVTVDVKAQYADEYALTVVLVENDVIGYQSDYNNGNQNDFNHSRVARMILTAYTGDVFAIDAAGSVKTLTYEASIPDGCKPENMEVLAYVQRPFGLRPAFRSGDYGDWYVDNARSAALGATAPLEVE